MKTIFFTLLRIICMLIILWPAHIYAQTIDSSSVKISRWYLSLQYLGLTYHPGGGTTPEIYPLKLDKKAYLDLEVGRQTKSI